MPKKYVPIKYTSREFSSIKKDLIDYVEYYPETYKDFSDSFGSLMIDTVSYMEIFFHSILTIKPTKVFCIQPLNIIILLSWVVN